MSARPLAALAVLLAALLLPATAAAAEEKPRLYVALGDSYAIGYQPTVGGATRSGYADELVERARDRGWDLGLRNFGCAGETSRSIFRRHGACPSPAVRGARYTQRSQAAAALEYIRRHRERVALITVSIGGNDVTPCALEAEPLSCVAGAVRRIERKVGKLARLLRRTAGKQARIVGLTYPDVLLAAWLRDDQELARTSVRAFAELVNPALESAYERVGGRFIDVTEATGAYGSLEETVEVAGYGPLPVPVAEVCRLTYACALGDIHARPEGYALMADLIARTLPRRRG